MKFPLSLLLCSAGLNMSSSKHPAQKKTPRVRLSGSNTGKCAVSGACFSSLDYGRHEECTFTVSEGGVLEVISFDTEVFWEGGLTDYLAVGGEDYFGASGPQHVAVSTGDEITWSSDGFDDNNAGFEICIGDPCVASSVSSDDGSDGYYYCVNRGQVDGIAGSCTCTCPSGSGIGGPNCASCAAGYSGTPPDECSADPCRAISNSNADGTDGNFYCVNGGDIGGTTGSCKCTCPSGFFGPSCDSDAAISLSGSNMGKCTVSGACFTSLDYGDDERCTFTVNEDGLLDVISFSTEARFDKLTVKGVEYSGSTGPQGVTVSAGDQITWTSDFSDNETGVAICVVDPCVGGSSRSDDSSGHNFDCVNGGG